MPPYFTSGLVAGSSDRRLPADDDRCQIAPAVLTDDGRVLDFLRAEGAPFSLLLRLP